MPHRWPARKLPKRWRIVFSATIRSVSRAPRVGDPPHSFGARLLVGALPRLKSVGTTENRCVDASNRASRLAFGAMWMAVYGAAATSVVWWAIWPAPAWLSIWCLVTLALGLLIAMLLVRVRRLTRGLQRPTFNRRLARNIGLVIVAYTLAEGLAAGGLHAGRHDAWIFPVAVMIAGAHFFVFARVLATWQYYLTGILDCLAAVIPVVSLNPSSAVGTLPSWVFYPLLGGGAALFITAAPMACESAVILRHLSSTPPARPHQPL